MNKIHQHKAVFLDRDGTLIIDKHYLNDPERVEMLPGVPEGLERLKKAGYLLVVITNQSGVARGIVQEENIKHIHERLQKLLSPLGQIDRFYHSPHAADSNHPHRKPNPGLLFMAADELQIDLSQSFMVGDKNIDVEAGHNAGAQSILLSESPTTSNADFIATNFLATVDWILKPS